MRRIYLIGTIVFTVNLLGFGLCAVKSQPEQNKNVTKNSIVSVQEDPRNKLGLIYSVKKLEEASILLKDGKLDEAEKNLIDVKQWLTDSSNYHYALYEAFKKYPGEFSASKIEKAHALDFAKVRDQADFLLAKLYIAQNKFKETVDSLIGIIKSQPDSELANESYKLLQQIKFSDKS